MLHDCIETQNTVAAEQLGSQLLHCGWNADILWRNHALTYR
jgi:hypothetical protein